MIAAGRTNPEIAEALGITLDGAKFHVSEILRKLNVGSREEAASYWQEYRKPVARLDRWVRSILPSGTLGWLAAGGAGVAAIGAVAVTAALWSNLGPRDGDQTTATPVDVQIEQDPELQADWIPFVNLGGVHYVARQRLERDALPLGPEYGRVEVNVAVDPPSEGFSTRREGEAAYLPAGTRLFEVGGYDPRFRIGTLVEGQLWLYEVMSNPEARTGADLLDIRDRVTAFTIWPSEDREGPGERRTEEPATLEMLVAMVLAAPIEPVGIQRELGHGRGITFHLADGTTLEINFFPQQHYLSLGLSVPADFREAAESLGERDR